MPGAVPRSAGSRIGGAALDLLCLAAVLAPLSICVASDVLHTSLWLDEVTYHFFEDDRALRAAELGRPGKALVPYLGVFFHADVQYLFHAAIRPFGLTLQGDPELYLRLSSVLFFAAAAMAVFLFLKRSVGRGDALLGAVAFGSVPIFLHYAFEARTYAMTMLLVVLVLGAVDAAARRPGPGRFGLVAILAVLAAHSHAWTACVFAGLLGAAAAQRVIRRRLTPWGRAAVTAAIPVLVLVGAETLYMRATDPGDPLFPPFARRGLGTTLWHLLFSNFTGVRQTRFIDDTFSSVLLQVLGGGALVTLAVLTGRQRSEEPDGSSPRAWLGATAGGLAICAILAVTYGFYMHARYSVPLMGGFLFAAARFPTRPKRLLLVLLVSCQLALLPKAIEGLAGRGSMKQVAALIDRSADPEAGVVCQHAVAAGFALPAQSVVLDFYLNVLHPKEPPIRIYELPDLSLVNGRRGVYDVFAGGPASFERYLRSLPDLWCARRDALPPHLFVLQQAWNLEAGNRQSLDFARVMLENGERLVVSKRWVTGFPPALLVELRRARAFSGTGPSSPAMTD